MQSKGLTPCALPFLLAAAEAAARSAAVFNEVN
jgi:cytochrome c biogenesis protein CcdA